MGTVDSYPLVSQGKSLVQLSIGDKEGAKETQRRFLRTAPFVSQVTSAIHLLKGNKDEAGDIQVEFIKGIEPLIDRIPIIGHAKGIYHLTEGEDEKANVCFKVASRTLGVIGGGTGGFLLFGVPGAVIGGIVGGLLSDIAITMIESTIQNKFVPNGAFLNGIAVLMDEDLKLNKMDAYQALSIYNLVISVIADGFIGSHFTHTFNPHNSQITPGNSATALLVQNITGNIGPHWDVYKQIKIKGLTDGNIIKGISEDLQSVIDFAFMDFREKFMTIYQTIGQKGEYGSKLTEKEFDALSRIPERLEEIQEFIFQALKQNTTRSTHSVTLVEKIVTYQDKCSKYIQEQLAIIKKIYVAKIDSCLDGVQKDNIGDDDQKFDYVLKNNQSMVEELTNLFKIVNNMANVQDYIFQTIIECAIVGVGTNEIQKILKGVNMKFQFLKPDEILLRIGSRQKKLTDFRFKGGKYDLSCNSSNAGSGLKYQISTDDESTKG